MDLTTAYDILGVSETASLDEVKACYRKRARSHLIMVEGVGVPQRGGGA